MVTPKQFTPQDVLANILTANPAFASVPEETLEALTSDAEVLTARRGATIYKSGDNWRRVGFVLDGSVGMLASTDGSRAHLYEHIGAGHFFGVSALFDGKPEMAHTLVLSKEATFAWMERDRVLSLCRADATLAMSLANVIAARLRTVTELLAHQVSLSAPERLARFLLNFTDAPGMSPALDPLPAMTQTQIASAAGTVKEVAARIIGKLEDANALRRERGRIRYVNRERLMELVQKDRA